MRVDTEHSTIFRMNMPVLMAYRTEPCVFANMMEMVNIVVPLSHWRRTPFRFIHQTLGGHPFRSLTLMNDSSLAFIPCHLSSNGWSSDGGAVLDRTRYPVPVLVLVRNVGRAVAGSMVWQVLGKNFDLFVLCSRYVARLDEIVARLPWSGADLEGYKARFCGFAEQFKGDELGRGAAVFGFFELVKDARFNERLGCVSKTDRPMRLGRPRQDITQTTKDVIIGWGFAM